MSVAAGRHSPKHQRGVTARLVVDGVAWDVVGVYRPVKRDAIFEMAWRVSAPNIVYGPQRMRMLGLHSRATEALVAKATDNNAKRSGEGA